MQKIKKQSVGKNLLFQYGYQAIILIIPLIVSPYLTRTLGDTELGVFAYANSIASYFIVLANLGISKHGQRIIASNVIDNNNLRRAFWSLYTLHLIISVMSSILYFTFVFLCVEQYSNIYYIEGLFVISALFDITWLFYGLENFKSVVIKNGVIKLLETALIFGLIKNESDLWIYTLITAGGMLLGQAVMIPQAVKAVKPISFSMQDVKQHLKPMLVFSITVVAVTLYTVFDKTLLGLMTTYENVAYYEYANKILTIPKTLIIVVGTVMFPRACKMSAEGDSEGQKKYLKLSLFIVLFVGFAALFGILGIANDFAVVYFGESFAESGNVMKSLCAIPLIIGIGEIIRSQYLIPNHRDKEYIICIILNACINLILSYLLIPVLDIYGAVIGTLAAELFGCVFQMYICRKYVDIMYIFTRTLSFAFIGFLMYCCIEIAGRFVTTVINKLIIQFILGAVVYVLLSVLYMLIFEKDIVRMAIKRIITNDH